MLSMWKMVKFCHLEKGLSHDRSSNHQDKHENCHEY